MALSKENQALLIAKIKQGDRHALNSVYEQNFQMISKFVSNNRGV